MKLVLISPLETQEYILEWLEVQTTTGMHLIKKDHEPMIGSLQVHSTILFLTGDNERISRIIKNGFIYVERKQVMILLKE